MIILSHRGYWKKTDEKNKKEAFERSFKLGFGTETDVRDYKGSLVISHDIADEASMSIDEFFSIYTQFDNYNIMPLALNIKSDGLQEKLSLKLKEYGVSNYFVFDMSVPDTLGYLKYGLKTYVRYSEYEPLNNLYFKSNGVWLDGFKESMFETEFLKKCLDDKKSVCIVSPDLHKRSNDEAWNKILSMPKSITSSNNIMICTDVPEEAERFFNVN